jgi:hypothetical protein
MTEIKKMKLRLVKLQAAKQIKALEELLISHRSSLSAGEAPVLSKDQELEAESNIELWQGIYDDIMKELNNEQS